MGFCGYVEVECGLRRFPGTERDGQIEDHRQNLEVTYEGTESSFLPLCMLMQCFSHRQTVYVDSTQEMVMGLKTSQLVRLKPEHINHWFGMILCKHVFHHPC